MEDDVTLRLGRRTFGDHDLVLMAVINVTPDSFYRGGATFDLDVAQSAVDRAVVAGADIVDIGGVAAGPGQRVTVTEEIRRTADLVAAVREHHPGLVVSLDTWRAEVAEVVRPDLVNDPWGGVDPRLAEVAAAVDAGLVCAHAGGLAPRTMPHRVGYHDVVADIVVQTAALAERAVSVGVRRDGILLDPAHDFGKNSRHSLLATRRLDELVATGWPVLVALSRKDFLGEALDLPVEERLAPTLAATTVCAWLGARVFRTHDVLATRRVLDTVSVIRGDRDVAVARRGLA